MAFVVFLALSVTAVFASDFKADLVTRNRTIGPALAWVSALTKSKNTYKSASTAFKADLVTGESTIGPGISWVSALTTPRQNKGTCGCHMQGVIKLTFNRSDRTKAEITFSLGNSNGWTFHIGDSSTNNGYAGDSGTQSNDAEMHSIHKDLFFYGRDKPAGGTYGLLHRDSGILGRGDFKVTVEDGLVTAGNAARFIYFDSDKMFQLKGQSDKEGPVNYDVYIGLNRVVSATYRSGTGLCNVEINWV